MIGTTVVHGILYTKESRPERRRKVLEAIEINNNQ